MSKSFQLYELASKDLKLPVLVDRNGVIHSKKANYIPMICWPDRTWCLEANLYIQDCYDKNLSRGEKGSTLGSYAASISPIIRYCFNNKIRLNEMSDRQFSFFMITLCGERNPKTGSPRRSNNSNLEIGRRTLSFLAYVGWLHGDPNFVGEEGSIRAYFKNHCRRGRNSGKLIFTKYWHHNSFPKPSPLKVRLPVSKNVIEKITEAAVDDSFLKRRRRFTMIKLLETTGCRVSELVSITVESIYEADKTPEGEIPLITLPVKKGEKRTRTVPISRHDIRYFIDYIENSRRLIISKTCKSIRDQGYILVSLTTGGPLRPNTITQEIHELAKICGILGQLCPHMFRHRFCTEILLIILKHHKLETTTDLKNAMLSLEDMKEKVLEWSGHKSVTSLEPYIHLAVAELSNYSKTYDGLILERSIDSSVSSLHQLVLESKSLPHESAQKALQLLSLVKCDLLKYIDKYDRVSPL